MNEKMKTTDVSSFVTKDSGERQEFESGMVRDTQKGKLRHDLSFDGPLFWALFRNTKFTPLVLAAETWYNCGGLDAAADVIHALADLEGGLFIVIDRHAALMMRGAIKYTEQNWMKANSQDELKRFVISFCHHLKQYLNGETDEDHMAALYFNMNGAEYVRFHLENRKEPLAF